MVIHFRIFLPYNFDFWEMMSKIVFNRPLNSKIRYRYRIMLMRTFILLLKIF